MGNSSGGTAQPPAAGSRRWLFSHAILDERSLTLTVDGAVKALDPKPLEVLLHLLHHAGEVVTKDELLAAVWPGRIISDSALTSCVARLRDGLADEDQSIIKTVHGYGYRLIAPVKVEASTAPPPPRFDFKPGDSPQGHANWKLVERLGTGGHGEVWLARQEKTGEPRIFKYALDPEALPSLKREITLSRYLHDTLGDDSPFVRVLDWNLDAAPFCIQAEYTQGGNLTTWALVQGGIAKVPFAARLDLAIKIAEALAAAHSVGVLHKDLKPSNVLIDSAGGGSPRIRLSDFGSGGVLEPGKLDALGITRMGLTMTQGMSATSGTPIYLAPEIIAEQPATMQTDIYAMGVLLYQLIVADLKRPLAPGWEHDVEDELLREDIAAAAAGNPARRLKDAAELALRLRSLSERRGARMSGRMRAEHWRPAAWSAAALLLIAGAAGAWYFMRDEGDSAPVESLRLSVLRFGYINPPHDSDYFSEGLAQELVSGLARLPGLQVTSLSGSKPATAEPHLELGGSVETTASHFRLAVELNRVPRGGALWTRVYEGDPDGVPPALDDIVASVASRLGLASPQRAFAVGTRSAPAFDSYLQGLSRNGPVTLADNAAATSAFERAVALDPQFARAWSQLAGAYLLRIHFLAPGDTASMKKGFAAAERSLSLDASLVDAHIARAGLLFTPANGFAAEESAREFMRAASLAGAANAFQPSSGFTGSFASALGGLAVIDWHWGLLDAFERIQQLGLQRYPDSNSAKAAYAQALIHQGKFEQGLELMEQTPREIAPVFWYWPTTWALVELGRKQEAAARVDEFFRTHQDIGGLMTSLRAVVAASLGDAATVQAAVDELGKVDRRFGHFHHAAYNLAMALALMNRREEALEWLDWSTKHGFPCGALIRREAFFESLRNETKFQQILDYTVREADKIRALGSPRIG